MSATKVTFVGAFMNHILSALRPPFAVLLPIILNLIDTNNAMAQHPRKLGGGRLNTVIWDAKDWKLIKDLTAERHGKKKEYGR